MVEPWLKSYVVSKEVFMWNINIIYLVYVDAVSRIWWYISRGVSGRGSNSKLLPIVCQHPIYANVLSNFLTFADSDIDACIPISRSANLDTC